MLWPGQTFLKDRFVSSVSKHQEERPRHRSVSQSRADRQANAGGMDVESEPGKGTTFLVSFPVSDEK
jgi:hypothetical protein